MSMNYYHKEIFLDVPATPLNISEWIRSNKCPNLDFTIFRQDGGTFYYTFNGYMVSLEVSGLDKEGVESFLHLPSGTIDRDWVEYEGMYEGYIDCGCIQVYWLLIEDKLYKATHI